MRPHPQVQGTGLSALPSVPPQLGAGGGGEGVQGGGRVGAPRLQRLTCVTGWSPALMAQNGNIQVAMDSPPSAVMFILRAF